MDPNFRHRSLIFEQRYTSWETYLFFEESDFCKKWNKVLSNACKWWRKWRRPVMKIFLSIYIFIKSYNIMIIFITKNMKLHKYYKRLCTWKNCLFYCGINFIWCISKWNRQDFVTRLEKIFESNQFWFSRNLKLKPIVFFNDLIFFNFNFKKSGYRLVIGARDFGMWAVEDGFQRMLITRFP